MFPAGQLHADLAVWERFDPPALARGAPPRSLTKVSLWNEGLVGERQGEKAGRPGGTGAQGHGGPGARGMSRLAS